MKKETDFLLFDALRSAGQAMRAHKPDDSKNCGPAVKREIILAILCDSDGSMRQNRLAEAFRVSPSTLSEMLNKLEADGLITRSTDPADRRATLLSLTESGKKRAEEIKGETKKRFAEIFRELSEDEKQQLISLLHKIDGAKPQN